MKDDIVMSKGDGGPALWVWRQTNGILNISARNIETFLNKSVPRSKCTVHYCFLITLLFLAVPVL